MQLKNPLIIISNFARFHPQLLAGGKPLFNSPLKAVYLSLNSFRSQFKFNPYKLTCLKIMAKIKVLLVEDSDVAINIYEKMLNSSSQIEVIGKAKNGKEGLDLVSQLNPDVICTDLQMPQMNGLEFTKQVMAHYPTPILVLSNTVQKADVENIYEVMKAGAVDVMAKPQTALSGNSESMQNELIVKIRVLANKKVTAIPLK